MRELSFMDTSPLGNTSAGNTNFCARAVKQLHFIWQQQEHGNEPLIIHPDLAFYAKWAF